MFKDPATSVYNCSKTTHQQFAKLKRTTNFGFVMVKPGTKEAEFMK